MKVGRGKIINRKRKAYRGKSKAFAKKVKKICKAVVMRNVETKARVINMGGTLQYNTLQTWNLLSYLSRGAGSEQFIGQEIYLKGIRLDWAVNNDASTATAQYACDLVGTIGILKTDEWFTSTNIPKNSVTDSQYNPNDYKNHCFDSDKCQILFSKKVVIRRNLTNQFEWKNGTNYVKINRKIQFKYENSAECLKGNYYLFYWFGNYNGSITDVRTGEAEITGKIYFKDA